MSVTGAWINVYGSVVTLVQLDGQLDGGVVAGTYTSTTGSSGSYWVVGFTDPNPPVGGNGQSLAFCILWRSFSGGTPDPSWHYVSGFSGQMVTVDGTPNLVMIHDMVATTPDPGVVAMIGSYPDKLTYLPHTSGALPDWPPPFTQPTSADPVDGNWSCVQDPIITLTLTVQDLTSGYLTGTLGTAGGSVSLAGFTDNGAGAAGLTLQGLTVSALLPDGMVVAVAGSLNLATDALTMSWLESNGTAEGSTYMQTRLRGLEFRRG
ncbi:MAG TPA: avidin/streptavidin family protein [Thermoanaerobaculia bacterium]